MSIHVSPSLDQNQQICRPISFYDLVELMTFGRLFFDQSSRGRLASTRVAYQSWILLEHEHAIDWGGDDASAPSIHIVSTIRALTESLFVGEGLEVVIDRTSHCVRAPMQRRSTDSCAVPILDDGTLAVTLLPHSSDVGTDQRLVPRLPIELNTLLTSVLVSPRAPTRFVELISGLVQRICHARVARAGLSLESAV